MRIRYIKRIFFSGILMCFMMLAASASITQPVLLPDNPNCCDIGYCGNSLKLESAPWEGTYAIDSGSITITMINATHFNFVSTVPINAFIVKAGPNAMAYIYETPVLSDTVLGPPFNYDNSKYYNISHIEICYIDTINVSEFPAFIFGIFFISGLTCMILTATYRAGKK